MFTTTRRSISIIRKLVDNDKSIGKMINTPIFFGTKRNYIVKQNDLDSYGKDINKTYSINDAVMDAYSIQTEDIGYMSSTLQNHSQSALNYSINDAVMDTISIQTEDIRYIKLELISLNSKMKKIMNKLDLHDKQLAISCKKRISKK